MCQAAFWTSRAQPRDASASSIQVKLGSALKSSNLPTTLNITWSVQGPDSSP